MEISNRQKIKLELKTDIGEFEFFCDPGCSVQAVKDALAHFNEYCDHVIQKHQKASEEKEEKDQEEALSEEPSCQT